MDQQDQKQKLLGRIMSALTWFNWVAALTVVNALMAVFDIDMSLAFGLTSVSLVEAILMQVHQATKLSINDAVIVFVYAAISAGIFYGLGRAAGAGRIWPIVLALVLYSGDTLLTLLAQMWIGLACHAYVTYRFVDAVIANIKLARLLKTESAQEVAG
ncbi:MAG: hypothetical protein J0H83_14220 [Candidatus Melainabacteria bacterium]|nr:hypothetical protein [Candidatus Melainabacteria bacterium]